VLNYSAITETYATWQARNFPSNPNAGAPGADPDGDGRPNLVEYALGSNPNAGQPGGGLDVAFDGQAFFLTLVKGPGANKDVLYEIQSSPTFDPSNWSGAKVTILENNAARLRARYDGTNTSGFLRVKVTLAP
jgi:hypothetical protein